MDASQIFSRFMIWLKELHMKPSKPCSISGRPSDSQRTNKNSAFQLERLNKSMILSHSNTLRHCFGNLKGESLLKWFSSSLPSLLKRIWPQIKRVHDESLFFPFPFPFCAHLYGCLVLNCLSLVHFINWASLGHYSEFWLIWH